MRDREPRGSGTVIVSSRIPTVMRLRLRRLARKRGMTLNRLIKKTLQAELDKEGEDDVGIGNDN